MTERQRADLLLVERGFFESRAKAQAAIAAGLVRANGKLVTKPSETVPRDAAIEAEAAFPFVSRGGVKLEAALKAFASTSKIASASILALRPAGSPTRCYAMVRRA